MGVGGSERVHPISLERFPPPRIFLVLYVICYIFHERVFIGLDSTYFSWCSIFIRTRVFSIPWGNITLFF